MIWVFGYGSIIWDNAEYNPKKIIEANLTGAHRSFNKKSTLTRGTKLKPGLVLGLEYGGETLGKAFLIDNEAFSKLKKREKGYLPINTPTAKLVITTSEDEVLENCIVFYPDSKSPNFLKDNTSINEKAEIILSGGNGKRGNSKEYLKEVYNFLNDYDIEDKEVKTLYKIVYELS